jgi:hypothetical protein
MFFVTVAIAHLISVEVLGGAMPAVVRSVATVRIFAVVAVIRVVVIVDIAMEVLGAVKPRAGADKDAIGKPLGAIITVGSATVWRHIVITVRTSGGDTDANADLGLGLGSTCCNA